MAEKLDPMVRLRVALEGGQDPAHNPDAFAKLVGAFLEAPGDPYMVLCKAAFGNYVQGERSFFDWWAAGLTTPTPLTRQKVVRKIREEYGRLQKKGP